MSEGGTSRWMEAARAKLYRICGDRPGEDLLQQAMRACGLEELRSADDLYAVADHFVKQPGFMQAIGYALQFQATLHGGHPPAPGNGV